MKKKIYFLAVIVVTAFLMWKLYNVEDEKAESRGVFFSYIECIKYFKDKDKPTIEKNINEILETMNLYHLNRIYLQVRPFSDSIYKSAIFPSSNTVVTNQGDELKIDILAYFIKQAQNKNIEVYAWINPYRISNDTDISLLSTTNPAYKWLNTNNVKIIPNKGIFYNPASKEVINLIINGVKEIVSNYDIDGILLDDYFYPDDTIDLENYNDVINTITLNEFRLDVVNSLISGIYKSIKEINSKVQFGISPDGNIDNNYEIHYADINKWLSDSNYIDFIVPQLYYGFNNEVKPYIKTLNEWNDLIKNKTKLIVATALYKSGCIDNYAKKGKNEWIEYNDIITKQIRVARNISNYDGYVFFRYDYLVNNVNDSLTNELNNYLSLF